MASLIRSAKSGNDWGLYELYAFNIEIVGKTADEFFDHTPFHGSSMCHPLSWTIWTSRPMHLEKLPIFSSIWKTQLPSPPMKNHL